MQSKPVSHFIAGLIVAAVAIIFFLVYYFMGRAFEKDLLSWLPAIVTMVLIIMFVLSYAKANNSNMTFGGLFGYGFKTAAIYALIMTVFMLALLYVFPEYKAKFLEEMSSQMDKKPNLTEDQKDTAMKVMEKFFSLSLVGGTLFVSLIEGTIASLIGAAVAKKNPQSPFTNQV